MRYSTIVFFLLLAGRAAGQLDTTRSPYGSYYFEGEDVVFEFDVRKYVAAVQASDSLAIDFADLAILQVAVTGTFNGWSKEGWVMQQIDRYRFRLRKKITDFKDAPNWQFRFLINSNYWAPPDSNLKKQGVLGWYDLRNPNAPKPQASDTGNVLFRLKGFPNNGRVILTGSFNNWDEQALQMRRAGDGWQIQLSLKPGVYEYKFIVDGNWMEDPANPEKRRNQYGTFNSVLRVTKTVRFGLKGYDDARQVILSGSFNGWNKNALKMRRSETGWEAEVPLTGGKHLYKFIVDGNWITDPANPRTETSIEGHVNSVLFVR